MAFGSAPGYPASHSQMRRLTELVTEAGFTDFREARGQLGLTQRQAGGKFTGAEADELITQLEADAEASSPDPSGDASAAKMGTASRRTSSTADKKAEQQAALLRKMPVDLLAAELQRRGWIVVEP